MSKTYAELTYENLYKWHIEQDMTTVDISKVVGCHRDSVKNALKRVGIKPRGKIIKPVPLELQDILNVLYVDKKMSTRQIGKIIGVDHATVSHMLIKMGVAVDDRFVALSGERNPDWKGGTTQNGGYVEISSLSICGKHTRVHRLIMEQYIGRPLKSHEVVHHTDGDKSNNNIDNLALMDIAAHTRLHSLERWNKNA